MPIRRAVLVIALLLSSAVAQELRGGLTEVFVEGTTEYADLVKVIISARPGIPVERIDLEAERNRVYSLGTFKEVSVSLEDRGAGPILVIRVKENPAIFEVVLNGIRALQSAPLVDFLRQQNLVEAGAVYNTTRAEEAIGTLQEAYRQAGFPFDVPIVLTVEPILEEAEGGAEPPVRLRYTVSENEPVDEITFEGATVLEESKLRTLFHPLRQNEEGFDLTLYRTAVEAVADDYSQLGYRQSGVNLATTELANGVLAIRLRELRIVSIDTTAIGVDASELSLAVGDLFNFDLLLEDIRRLAEGRSGDVRLVPRILPTTGEVRISFELGPPETAGPVVEVRIEGNTVVPTEELLELLELSIGDTFVSVLAQEDFLKVRQYYADKGYLILNQPNFNYLDGTYVQRITELKVVGYQVTFRGGRDNSQDFLVTRYMPPVGSVVNEFGILAGLREVARLGAVRPLGREFIATDAPDAVIVNLVVEETATGRFTPSARYATDSGFSAAAAYSEGNFLGRGHRLSADLDGQSSGLGLELGAQISYSIPWIYVDVLDFREVPTSVSVSLFSQPEVNIPLTAGGSIRVGYPGLPATEANRVRIGEYTTRNTGISFSVGRSILENTNLLFSAFGSVSEHKLGPPSVKCTFDNSGNVENGGTCSLPSEDAAQFLPQGGLSSFLSTRVTYDDRDNPDFPRAGVAATGRIGIGFGNDFRNAQGERKSYLFQQVEFGIKTYILLQNIAPGVVQSPNHVLAFRVNLGHQFGNDFPVNRHFRVGRTSSEATLIRGYTLIDFNLSRTYATGSVEYRYDFGLDTFATQTVIGIAFLDFGYASSVPDFPDYGAPIFAGAGIGVQVNLGFGGVLLPALRLDYGFSQRNPSGVFSFRIGPVF